MPDFTLQSFAECDSAQYWKMPVGNYIVEYKNDPTGQFEKAYTCTCQGFKFYGRCKHIQEAKKHHCNWIQFIDGDSPIDGKCPNCGNVVHYRNWAV